VYRELWSKKVELPYDMLVPTTPLIPAQVDEDTRRMLEVFLMRKFWLR